MRRRKDEAEQTREALLDAAEQLFFMRGFAGTTLEAICKAAGLTRGAFYWHFTDKVDLLKALHDRNALPQDALIEAAAVHGHEDPLGLLQTLGAEVLAIFEVDESRQRMFSIMSLKPLGDEGSDWLQLANARMFGTLKRLMVQSQTNESLRPDFSADEAAITMMLTMNGLLTEWLRSNKAFPLSAFGAKLIGMQTQLLKAQPHDKR